jgi:2-polyprenyl-3-methyl-5-hydroxy-6-metoxy-1,4-benzoquinol methylase
VPVESGSPAAPNGAAGPFNPSYVGERPDILAFLPGTARAVLDVGCSVGTLGSSIRQATGARVIGIELDPAMAAVARTRLDGVLVADVSRVDFRQAFPAETFDAIVFADILEHLPEPWRVLERALEVLAPGGTVIASLPNVRHFTTILGLAFGGSWPRRERGIHDRTHLRFFTWRSIRELYEGAGLRITAVKRHYRVIERPHRLNRLAPLLAWPGLRGLLTYQYVVAGVRADRLT